MKTFTFAVAAPLLVALFGSIVNTSPAPAYPGCEAASNAAAIGDETALKNAIAACSAAGSQPGSGSAPAPKVASAPSAGGDGCYECGPASQYYQPGCHCENTLYTSE